MMDIQVSSSNLDEVLREPMFEGLWENISDGALVIDTHTRRIVKMNAKARELLGYKPSEVMGCQCRKMMNSPACATACPLTALLEGKKQGGELDLYYRGIHGKQMLHAHTKMLLIRDPEGNPIGGVELFSDLRELQALKKALHRRRSLAGIVGGAGVMQELYVLIEQIAPYDIPVLLTGESGVGKERFADAIHHLSQRATKPFVKVNCAALSPMLVESELFGHRKGAFTGATMDRKGSFEEAHGGTLLLDEVGELPLEMQAKLLRFLQEGELQRIGEDRVRKVDVRVIAATNRNLEREIQAGHFRQDLYYRLLGVQMVIPPLRERREDIPLLVEHILDKIITDSPGGVSLKKPKVAEEVMLHFMEHDWPGNVRELVQALRLAVILAQKTGEISSAECPVRRTSIEVPAATREVYPEETHSVKPFVFKGFSEEKESFSLKELEIQCITGALEKADGNITAAAKLLEIDRTTLWRKLKKYNMKG